MLLRAGPVFSIEFQIDEDWVTAKVVAAAGGEQELQLFPSLSSSTAGGALLQAGIFYFL